MLSEKVESLRKQGYCYLDIYHKLDFSVDDRKKYECESKKIITPKINISLLEIFFVLLSVSLFTLKLLK